MGLFWMIMSFWLTIVLVNHGWDAFWAALVSVVAAVLMIQLDKPRTKP